MKHLAPTALLAAFALVLGASSASAQTVDRTSAPAMVAALNAERATTGAPPLAEDPRLDALAEAHSFDMVRAGYFSHDSPTEGGPADRVTHAGLGWSAVAENIAINASPQAAEESLLHSPGHHQNMVDPAQRAVGIGIVRRGEQVWVTQLFAALTSPAPALATQAPTPAAVSVVTPVAAPVAAPVTTPAVLAAPEPPAATTTPSTVPGVPVLPALPPAFTEALQQVFGGLGLPSSTQPSSTASTSRGPRSMVVPTPFGPLRVELGTAPVEAPPPATVPHATPAVRRHPAPSHPRVTALDTLDV